MWKVEDAFSVVFSLKNAPDPGLQLPSTCGELQGIDPMRFWGQCFEPTDVYSPRYGRFHQNRRDIESNDSHHHGRVPCCRALLHPQLDAGSPRRTVLQSYGEITFF
jgi:hypothetical protein